MQEIFFNQFYLLMAKKCPGIAISILFCWSMSLYSDNDYEMDETDVFNKCRNYDCFEPVQVSDMCFQVVKLIIKEHFTYPALPVAAIHWMNSQLNINLPDIISFSDIIIHYKKYIPVVERHIHSVLDPTYKEKLLQSLAYEKYVIGTEEKQRAIQDLG